MVSCCTSGHKINFYQIWGVLFKSYDCYNVALAWSVLPTDQLYL